MEIIRLCSGVSLDERIVQENGVVCFFNAKEFTVRIMLTNEGERLNGVVVVTASLTGSVRVDGIALDNGRNRKREQFARNNRQYAIHAE